MKLPKPDTHCFDEGTRQDKWSYSEAQVKELLAQADKDFSDGMTVVHLQVADQMRKRYEPVLKMALNALMSTPLDNPRTRESIEAVRKVLK